MSELTTRRLRLRAWREDDLDEWAEMNADPQVREHFPGVLDREASAESLARFQRDLEARGWGWWALEVRATGEFLGMTGLDPVEDGLAFTGVEAGWRLKRAAWGHGYATEAAGAALDFGFTALALPEILAVTTAGNLRSQAVMRRLGMRHDPARDFTDPAVPPGPLSRNVVYGLPRDERRCGPVPRA
ncbi:GNAT family N-acetyltransferase [Streptomyces sp. HNM0574]|uniref:GNAT family N-acetyltransferase n=1 Tax=Streptomyces sp. HNM0574 TaxID=2714954 RepID=UPI001469D8FA|nr:GNAT family N-acetyltransferase [Streptomyces sp. HNM0574]NLU71017.1 GNAT family N-acetyltransferase [Streptomyces sp. HNM0574]